MSGTIGANEPRSTSRISSAPAEPSPGEADPPRTNGGLTSEDAVCAIGGVIGLLLLSAGGVNESAQMLQSSCTGRAGAGLEPARGGVPVRGGRPPREQP